MRKQGTNALCAVLTAPHVTLLRGWGVGSCNSGITSFQVGHLRPPFRRPFPESGFWWSPTPKKSVTGNPTGELACPRAVSLISYPCPIENKLQGSCKNRGSWEKAENVETLVSCQHVSRRLPRVKCLDYCWFLCQEGGTVWGSFSFIFKAHLLYPVLVLMSLTETKNWILIFPMVFYPHLAGR